MASNFAERTPLCLRALAGLIMAAWAVSKVNNQAVSAPSAAPQTSLALVSSPAEASHSPREI